MANRYQSSDHVPDSEDASILLKEMLRQRDQEILELDK